MPGPKPVDIERWVRANYPETTTLILTTHGRCHLSGRSDGGGRSGLPHQGRGFSRVGGGDPEGSARRGALHPSQEQLERARRWRQEWAMLGAPNRARAAGAHIGGEGLSNAAIAEALCVTERTVEYHVTNMLAKLGVESRLEAAAWVREHLPDDLWKSTG